MNDRNVLGWSIALLLVAAPSAVAQNRSVPWYERGNFLHFAASAELATNGYTLGAAFCDGQLRVFSRYSGRSRPRRSWRDSMGRRIAVIGFGALGRETGSLWARGA